MAFNPNGAIQQLQQVEMTLRGIDKNIKKTLSQNKKQKSDHDRYQKRRAKQLKRTQRVLEKAGEAASRGTRKKRQGTSASKEQPYIMEQNLITDFVKARSDLNVAHEDLLGAAASLSALRKAASTLEHSNQINDLSIRTTRASDKLVNLIGKIKDPLNTIREENQSYVSSPPRIIEEYGMVSPGQLEDDDVVTEFQRMFPDVRESDLEAELAAYPTPDNTPPTSAIEKEHKSSSPPQKAKSKRRRRRRKTKKTPPRSPTLSPESQRILAELEREYQEDQKALKLAKTQAKTLKAEQANISAAFDPYGLDFGLTEADLEEVNEEARRLGFLDGGKRKKRKTRKRKRRRKTRKRKKKRRKRKTRRR